MYSNSAAQIQLWAEIDWQRNLFGMIDTGRDSQRGRALRKDGGWHRSVAEPKAAERINDRRPVQGGLVAGAVVPMPRPSGVVGGWRPGLIAVLGSTAGRFRGPAKSARSGIFAQTAYFSGLLYFPQTVFRCLHAFSVSFFHNGKLREYGRSAEPRRTRSNIPMQTPCRSARGSYRRPSRWHKKRRRRRAANDERPRDR